MVHEWVTEGYCVGFTTDKGLIIDLDNMKFRKALWIANDLLEKHNLEGYLLSARAKNKTWE
jgi:hypothetical protein